MTLNDYLQLLANDPTSLTFSDTLTVIDQHYQFTETSFSNGNTNNAAGQNSGSCKVFAFAIKHKLNKQQTLNMFAQFYHQDVLANPEGDDHQNIRQFILHGFEGLKFDGTPLS